jgi:hypothetical protein
LILLDADSREFRQASRGKSGAAKEERKIEAVNGVFGSVIESGRRVVILHEAGARVTVIPERSLIAPIVPIIYDAVDQQSRRVSRCAVRYPVEQPGRLLVDINVDVLWVLFDISDHIDINNRDNVLIFSGCLSRAVRTPEDSRLFGGESDKSESAVKFKGEKEMLIFGHYGRNRLG